MVWFFRIAFAVFIAIAVLGWIKAWKNCDARGGVLTQYAQCAKRA